MKRLSSLVACLLTIGMAVCWYCEESSWTEHQGKCYQLIHSSEYFAADQCRSKCAGMGANILCIDDAKTQQFVRERVGSTNSVWLDYSDAGHEGNYTWGSHCSNTGYLNWASVNKTQQGSDVNCAMLPATQDNWSRVQCESSAASCLCEKPAKLSIPTCPSGWTLKDDECFLIDQTKEATSWYDCRGFCSGLNGRMLCVNDTEKAQYIQDSMRTSKLPHVWLSLFDTHSSYGRWRWADGCDHIDFTNWDAAHNQLSSDDAAGCVAMALESGLWSSQDCRGQDTEQPKHCFCEGSGGDPNLLPCTSAGKHGKY